MERLKAPSVNHLIGWREWVALPSLGVRRVKAKIDTGARTSCLHAFDVEIFKRRSEKWVRFVVHPLQDNTTKTVHCEAPLHDQRWIKSSNGKREFRPVIRTTLDFGEQTWPIELTLTSRDMMGFRMLVGRQAIRRRFVVDAGRSFIMKEHIPKKKKKKKKKKSRIGRQDISA